MKVKCIDNSWGANLTLGKIYNVLNSDHDSHYIVSDSGKESFYYKWRFEIIKEEPMIKFVKEFEDNKKVKLSLEFNKEGGVDLIAKNKGNYSQIILTITKSGNIKRLFFSNKFGFKTENSSWSDKIKID